MSFHINSALHKLQSLSTDFLSFATSGVDDSAKILQGRPYGGVAILIRKSLCFDIKLIKLNSKRLCSVLVSNQNVQILIICAYLPCDNYSNDAASDEFVYEISQLDTILADVQCDEVLIAGDLNTQLDRGNAQCHALNQFMQRWSLRSLWLSTVATPAPTQPTQTASEINAQINHLLGGNIPNERVAPQPRPQPIGGLVRPPPRVLVRSQPRPQPIGGPLPKPATSGEHVQNYCNRGVYSDEQLAGLSLQRIEYFVVNNSCSHEFFKCAIGKTFKERCSTTTQAFDRSTVNCNFKYNVKYCPEYDHVLHCTIKEQRTSAQFACCSHPQQCIPISERCDGVPNCVDGEDENNCPSCSENEFPCVKGGKCIPWEKRCNGINDECMDGSNSDELNCGACPASKFQCASLAGTRTPCIDMKLRCNGIRDCPNGEDETNCKVKGPKFLLCENQKKSVPKQRWCDGKEDCSDGSDKKYCFW